jgi:outer membrane protein assembly factor BamB
MLACALIATVTAPAAAENWPQWRGPELTGATTEQHLPSHWTDKDVAWSTPLPGPSAATPVVWGDHVFVSAADKATHEVVALALDTRTGHILWQHPVSADRIAPTGNNMASPSPVTDGKHVWFLSGTGAIISFTMDGHVAWQRDLAHDYGEFVDFYGYSSSPLLYAGKLYILVLQNKQATAYGQNAGRTAPMDSYLLALDPKTGQTLWKHVRDTDATGQSREAYCTVYPWANQNRTDLVVAGGECVTGHDPATGQELWRWWFTPADRQTMQHVVPTPVGDERTLCVVRPEHRPVFALQPPLNGPVADTHIAWSYGGSQDWIASPLLYQGHLYTEGDRRLVCLDVRTGKPIWEHTAPGSADLQASLTAAGGKIYCINLNGELFVLGAGGEYQELFHTNFNDPPCRSAIVGAGGRLFVRTGSRLTCISTTQP